MANFLTFSYWLALNPGAPAPILLKGLLGVAAAFFLSSMGFWIARKKWKKNLYFKVIEKLFLFSLINFFSALALLFFIYESVPFFSSRFWFILWAAGIGTWLFFIIRLFLELPGRKLEREKQQQFNKYIP